jgi:putative DNA primase/helicase
VISGRTFVLCPQNDAEGQSQRSFAALADELRKNGGRVRVMSTPQPHKDPAEHLHAAGLEAFVAHVRASVASAPATSGAPAQVIDIGPPGDGDDGGDALRKFSTFPCTDLGNSERMVAHHGEDLRFVTAWKNWIIWDGTRWQEDTTGAVMRRAYDVVRAIALEAKTAKDAMKKEEILDWAEDSESASRIRSMVFLASSQDEVSGMKPADLDRDPWLLNVANGILDLRTGALGPHTREYMLSKTAPVAYDPEAKCPLWLAFLERVFAGDQSLIGYMQRATGYALTGLTREHCLFILYGTGRNGKGTFRDVIRGLMGEYAHEADFSTFEPSKNEAAGQPREDLVALLGKRFVAASEQNKEKRIDEALIKRLTGGDPIRARRLNENGFEFVPVAKYFLLVNDKPVIRGMDEGVWSRLRLIPFLVTIPEAERDANLGEKLRDELPGILNWAIEGCMQWHRHGMETPKAVTDATQEYREEMDVVGAFIQARCVVQAGASVPTKDLYEAFAAWCKETGTYAKTPNAFGREITKKGFDLDHQTLRHLRRGIGLREQAS